MSEMGLSSRAMSNGARRAARERQDRAGGCHQQRRAVGRRGNHLPRADDAGSARPVFRDDGLAPHRLQAGREHTAEHVGRAARRKRHDDAHLPGRIGLRLRSRGEQRKREQGAAREHQ